MFCRYFSLQKKILHIFDVIVIGAGGAGMMCAAQVGQQGRSVVVLDHNAQVGRKILISGGGRCNFTNVEARPENFVSKNPHFCKSALARYRPADFIKLVESYRIRYHEKKLGQLFCDDSARQIVDLLLDEMDKGGVKLSLNTKIDSVKKSEDFFEVETSRGLFKAERLVVATGGLSVPQVGATGFGYEIARYFNLKIVQTEPALDGFTWSHDDLDRFGPLAGVSLDTVVSAGKASFRENVLFTHTGLSGPASLQASLYWQRGQKLTIDLSPELDVGDYLLSRRREGVRQELKNVLAEVLPRRFADAFVEGKSLAGPLNGLAEKTLLNVGQSLKSWQVQPQATVGYRKAEVTRGGVDTSHLSSQTMECKTVPGLYFIGEVVDVTGQLGGYNFQWAWASAVSVAAALA
ncbi:MAG: NAD(P)/FAD-dependent oxidoreductase [Cyanobacteria bacterium REEB67]|nr:NAD(P)/FAD-dependent oxidoreductase [Cyanobacteria bacterium REEB67]